MRWLPAAAVLLILAACAQVPVVDESTSSARSATEIQLTGRRGALSRRQSRLLLERLAARSPDAGLLERHVAVEQAIADSPLFTGNQVQILRDGVQTFPAMFAAIRAARHYLYLEYYIFEDVACDGQQLGDLLIERARSGVAVYVIYDSIGSIGTPSDFFKRLSDAGVHVLKFNPPVPWASGHYSLNDRDHRKMLIADGTTAIIGGVNLSSTYQSGPSDSHPLESGGAVAGETGASKETTGASAVVNPGPGNEVAPGGDTNGKANTGKPADVWHDTDLQVAGPVIRELEKLFREQWHAQSGSAVDTAEITAAERGADGGEIVRIIGSSPRRLKSRYYVTVLSAIRNAEKSIWITSAYFVPTFQEKRDLIHAARHGVDVRLLLPSKSDSSPALQVQHSHYSDLLEAGVKVFERDDGILHSKTMVVDGVYSITGSSNFDHRSVLFNDEVDAVVLGQDTGGHLAALFEGDLKSAKAVDLTEWGKRSTLTKVREQFWRLWEKLL